MLIIIMVGSSWGRGCKNESVMSLSLQLSGRGTPGDSKRISGGRSKQMDWKLFGRIRQLVLMCMKNHESWHWALTYLNRRDPTRCGASSHHEVFEKESSPCLVQGSGQFSQLALAVCIVAISEYLTVLSFCNTAPR